MLVPYTAEYLQHHAVSRPDKKRAAYAKWTMLDAMLEDGLIDESLWLAGDRYATDLEISERGSYTSRYDDGGGGGSSSGLTPNERVALAWRRTAAVNRTLPAVQRAALMVLAHDAGWNGLRIALRCRRERAKQIAIEALQALGAFYDA